MIILTIRTDNPQAEIGLYKDKSKLAYDTYEAHRTLSTSLQTRILKLLKANKLDWTDIGGVVCYKGPGSFTGLRIGLSMANAFVYAKGIPIVGTTGDDWREQGIIKILSGENQVALIPEYGQEPHITKQKK